MPPSIIDIDDVNKEEESEWENHLKEIFKERKEKNIKMVDRGVETDLCLLGQKQAGPSQILPADSKNQESKSSKKGKSRSKSENPLLLESLHSCAPILHDCNAPSKMKKKNIKFSDSVILINSAMEGDLEMVKRLFELEKINIDTCNANGVTALHFSVATGNYEIAKYLISNGANVNVADHHSWSPLHNAAYENNLDLVKLLIENGACIEALTDQGDTGADLTSSLEISQIFKNLLRAKDESELLTAISDFDSESIDADPIGDELWFKKGDFLRILERNDSGWWLAEHKDEGGRGMIPKNFVQ